MLAMEMLFKNPGLKDILLMLVKERLLSINFHTWPYVIIKNSMVPLLMQTANNSQPNSLIFFSLMWLILPGDLT